MKLCPQLLKMLFVCLLFLSVSSCRKSDVHPNYAAGTSENINSWVLDSMKVYYYWNTSLPGNPNVSQDPSAFFKGLKNPADRFSTLVNPELPATYPPSLVHTLGFDLVTLQTSEGIEETMISLVMPNSRGAEYGMLRGDIVKTINGIVPSADNIAALTDKIIANETADLEIADRTGVVTIGKLINEEQPVYTYKVFRSAGKTYGYLFLNSFEETAVSPLEQAFAYFKEQQVQELLLDLRYNPGGSVPVAASLASMIAPNANAGNTFVTYKGNTNAGTRNSSFAAELAKLPASLQKGFAQFTGYRLGLNRIYVFTGGHTASAAELLINALKPYITIIQVGKQSLGKDMASFVIKDYRNPQVVKDWEIYPMVFKLYNAAGQGDYSSGLTPDQAVDEFSVLPLKPFGDLNDPLIQRCVAENGGGVISSSREKHAIKSGTVLFDSRTREDLKSAGVNIIRSY